MNTLVKFYFILLVIITSTSCSSDDLNVPQPSPFSVEIQNGNTIDKDGGKIELIISAGSNGWWIETPTNTNSWCIIPKKFGAGDYKMSVDIKKNDTDSPRSVDIIVNSTFNIAPITISINQL